MGNLNYLIKFNARSFPSYIDCRPIFVRQSIENAGFVIADVTKMSSFGLPDEIVVAKRT